MKLKKKLPWIGFGKETDKSMPTLSKDALNELKEIVENVHEKQRELKGVIFFGHQPGCFLAGVDISLINSLKTAQEAQQGAESGQLIYNRIEDLKIPTLALVDGICLGGGFELCLACDQIIASNSPKTMFGLPEIKLGVLPGFGGTYRLPKKIGLPNALDIILTGKNIRASKAKRMGIVEETYPRENLKRIAIKHLNDQQSDNLKESLEKLASDNFVSRKIIFQKARESVLKKTKGLYQAPLKVLDLMESGTSRRESYLQKESEAFGELCVSEQSQSLQHVFFLMDGAKKKFKYDGDKKVNKGAVLGAGTMGGGIAWLLASSGQKPIMKDINLKGLELGLKQSSKVFRESVKRKKLSKDDFERVQRSITPSLTYHGFKKVDLVIEAVVENIDIKKKVFAELEKEVEDDCLITSNTSSLSVNEMAKAFEKPERFAGLHFFNPVDKMPLVEIIRHDKVSEETIERLYQWTIKAKKTPVVVNDCPGFLVNRILMPFIQEAVYLLSEGVGVEQLDKAVLEFGMPMGPCRLMDEIGLDVLVHVGEIMHEGLGERAKPHDLAKKVVELGLLGRKNSKGFYLYDEKGKSSEVNPAIKDVLPAKSKSMSAKEIQLRAFLPMINEAARILDEKIVDNAAEVDLGLIFGIGFPPFRGGLLRYADYEGVEPILSKIEEYSKSVDAHRFEAAAKLKELVEKKMKFYDL